MDEVWREARWMVEVLQFARFKQQRVGVNLGSIIDFSKENIVEKTPSTSSQPDYLPSPVPSPVESPVPSPDQCRKQPGEKPPASLALISFFLLSLVVFILLIAPVSVHCRSSF